uniref:Uncharacterized protein n=1 Tax=Entomoneis paludosa TaxID=265537 RepID=A0A7S2YQN6_9STRA
MTTQVYNSQAYGQSSQFPPASIAFGASAPDGQDDITVGSSFQPPVTPAAASYQQPATPNAYGTPTYSVAPSYGYGGPTTPGSFQAAPAPVLNQDGEVTVVAQQSVYAQQPPSVYASAPPSMQKTTTSTAITPTSSATPESRALVPAQRRNSAPSGGTTALVRAPPTQLKGPHKTYPAEVEKMKIRRKRRTAAAGVAGGIVGLVALGPLGAVVGGAGGAAATRAIGKRNERKKREKIAAQKIAEAEKNAPEVLVHSGSML